MPNYLTKFSYELFKHYLWPNRHDPDVRSWCRQHIGYMKNRKKTLTDS